MASEGWLSIGRLLGSGVRWRDNDRMTSGVAGRATPRWWAVAALAGLALLAAGLLQVIVGSRGQVFRQLVVTALSIAVVAATAWWAFTTRRVWKRWLNLVIAALAGANIALGFLEFGLRQATGALAIVAGALLYVTAARRALWTTPSAGSRPGVASPTGGPDSGGSGSGTPGGPTFPAASGPASPWLLVNPRSGDGKAGRVGLVEAARAMGVGVHVLEAGDDPAGLARAAVAGGADAVGVAGGDGSMGLVAAVAVETGVPFVCVPSGTRNHFAGDLGLDREDPLAALEAFAGTERRVDVGGGGERVFVNNVSLGAYADLVADPRY